MRRGNRYNLLWLLIFCMAVAVSACGRKAEISVERVDSIPRLIVLSAFEPELAALVRQTEITGEFVVNGRTVTVGRLGGAEVALSLSGISMVNAAMAAQALLDSFDARAVIFSGIAGGVNPNLQIGDVVVPAQWGEYQENVFARQTARGWEEQAAGPEFANFGMMFPQPVQMVQAGSAPDAEKERFWFEVDPGLLDAARRAADGVGLDRCFGVGLCLDQPPDIVIGGNGVSGPTFVDNAEYRQYVWETFQADALDMESAAVAHVAYTNGVPFIAFRSLSDLAGGGPGENEVSTFFMLAARNAARTVELFIQELAESGQP
jgi:adenosylhomocysteine nucleosidase